MPYSQVKVYSDGSHYIGIPYIPDPRAKNRRPRYEEVIEVKEPISDAEVGADEELPDAIMNLMEQNPDNVQEKSAPPAVRQMTRKELFDELYMHFSCRKGWLYIGAWERGGETNRLHFHGLFYIPEGTISGEMEILRDFDTRKKKMQTIQQNTFFAKRFGRNEFRPIWHASQMPQAVKYLVKYIEKSGGKLIYSRGLYQYFVTDIMDEDIVCPYGLEDRKILLFDSFGCWIEGEYIGTVSPEVIARLPKVT